MNIGFVEKRIPTWKSIFLTLAILLLLICLLPGCGVSQEEYNKVERDLRAIQMELSQVTHELSQRDAELASLKNQYSQLQTDYNEVKNEYYDLLTDYTEVVMELEQSLTAPYTAISGRQITCAWKDRDGDLHKWTWPVDSYRSWIECSKPDETVRLKCGDTTYTMADFVPYVRTEFFSSVISSLYQDCVDEWAFAQEVFNLVTQLTVYSEDIGEVPRWPVETLTEAGGDCEDLAILFASLLKAAPYPYKLSLVYMDADKPTDPLHPNHVIVWVEADDWKLFVECTSDQGWGYYEEVVGWYYEL